MRDIEIERKRVRAREREREREKEREKERETPNCIVIDQIFLVVTHDYKRVRPLVHWSIGAKKYFATLPDLWI